MRVGFVVNPVAGMGGRVGLKGTDGKVGEARERGAEPRAPDRAREALEAMAERAAARGTDLELFVAGGPMGADAATAAGLGAASDGVDAGGDGDADPDAGGDGDRTASAPAATVTVTAVTDSPGRWETTAADTRRAVRAFLDRDVDVIVFVGGDGTAVDVAETIGAAGADTPMLGVPAGVKVYSGVFGTTPAAAGRVAVDFDRVADREVNDVDEDAFRGGEVVTDLKAVVRVPVADGVQSSKQLAGGDVAGLARGIAREARESGATYVLGPGGTLGAIKRELGFEGSPLGVDVWRDGDPLVRDGAERAILDALGDRNVVVVSPIGGQGFFFGRGNQQISPAIIRRSTVEVVASKAKLDATGVLRVDTGDPGLDEQLRGWRKVRVGAFERRMTKVV